MLYDLNILILGKLLLAAVLGGLVGLERELSRKPAGLRTNMLISLGAALFTIISYEMASAVGGDHTRIAAQIIPGIGFIGAGVVIRERGAIMGITSAATIFVVASIGMAAGAGMPATAIFATLLLLGCLVILGNVEQKLGLHMRLTNFRVSSAESGNLAERVRGIVEELGMIVRRWHSHKSEEGLLVDFDAEVTEAQEREFVVRLGAMNVRCEARPVRPVTAL